MGLDSNLAEMSSWTINIGELPNELFILIFEHASISGSHQIALSLSISHICRFWRSITLIVPTLWSTIDILNEAELAKQFLDRSNSAPFDIHMSLRPTTSKQEGKRRIERICSLTIPHHRRLRDITFHALYNPWFRASMSLLGNTRFDTQPHSLDMRLLQLYGSSDVDVLECDGLASRFTTRPTHLRLEGFPASNLLFFTPALRILVLRWPGCVDSLGHTSGIVDLLLQLTPCVNLEYLRLTHAMPPSLGNPTPEPQHTHSTSPRNHI